MIRLLALLLLLSTTGCSLLLVPQIRDADLARPEVPVCNDSYLAPVGDHALSGLGWPAVGITGLALSLNARCQTEGCSDRKTVGLVLFPVSMVVGALVHYVSGRYGLRQVARCQALKAAERHRTLRAAPLGPAPGPERPPPIEGPLPTPVPE